MYISLTDCVRLFFNVSSNAKFACAISRTNFATNDHRDDDPIREVAMKRKVFSKSHRGRIADSNILLPQTLRHSLWIKRGKGKKMSYHVRREIRQSPKASWHESWNETGRGEGGVEKILAERVHGTVSKGLLMQRAEEERGRDEGAAA